MVNLGILTDSAVVEANALPEGTVFPVRELFRRSDWNGFSQTLKMKIGGQSFKNHPDLLAKRHGYDEDGTALYLRQ